jgi:hypothetical protein
MSLRGSETIEAISQDCKKEEIAALPSVARNSKKGIAIQFLALFLLSLRLLLSWKYFWKYLK